MVSGGEGRLEGGGGGDLEGQAGGGRRHGRTGVVTNGVVETSDYRSNAGLVVLVAGRGSKREGGRGVGGGGGSEEVPPVSSLTCTRACMPCALNLALAAS